MRLIFSTSLDAAYLFNAAKILGVNPKWLATGNGSKFLTATQMPLSDNDPASPDERRQRLLELFDSLPPQAQLFLLGFLENIALKG